MPITLLVPLITACISASPAAINAVANLVKSFEDAGHTTVTPAHVTAIQAVIAAHAVQPAPINPTAKPELVEGLGDPHGPA